MLILIEGLAMCFLLLIVCVVGIANGAVGSVYFYEKDVQKRVVELGLTTEAKIKRRCMLASIALVVPILVLVPCMVYFVNGARGFWETFWQITAILMIDGLFDRFFIDWYWVGKTKAWEIPGTENLKPYIPRQTVLMKWGKTLVGYPVLAAIMAGVLSLF